MPIGFAPSPRVVVPSIVVERQRAINMASRAALVNSPYSDKLNFLAGFVKDNCGKDLLDLATIGRVEDSKIRFAVSSLDGNSGLVLGAKKYHGAGYHSRNIVDQIGFIRNGHTTSRFQNFSSMMSGFYFERKVGELG